MAARQTTVPYGLKTVSLWSEKVNMPLNPLIMVTCLPHLKGLQPINGNICRMKGGGWVLTGKTSIKTGFKSHKIQVSFKSFKRAKAVCCLIQENITVRNIAI